MKCWLAACVFLLATGAASAGEWTTARGNNARSGYTADSLSPKARLTWRQSIANAPIATCAEAVTGAGHLYVGSMNGTLYALKVEDGSIAWSFRTGGPILHAAAFADGRVYVGSVDGNIYCLDAADGKEIWHFAAGRGGFATAPCVEGGVVYMGARNGFFYAVKDEGTTGRLVWKFDAQAPIWQTAALANGKVYFMAENMIARCLNAADGQEVWKSKPVGGYRARDYYPCVVGDCVIFPTSPAADAELMTSSANAVLLKAAGVDKVDSDEVARSIHKRAEAEDVSQWMQQEAKAVNEFLDQHPEQRTIWIFSAQDGREIGAPLLWGGGCGGPMALPAVAADGTVVTFWRSFCTAWLSSSRWDYISASPHRGLGKLDPGTGRITRFEPDTSKPMPWGLFWRISDETSQLQVGGRYLYWTHQGEVGAIDLESRAIQILWQGRDKWAGGPCLSWAGGPCLSWAANEWNGPARGSLAIAGQRAFWICGSYIVAFEDRN